MKREGPSLEALMDRLAAVPSEFLNRYSFAAEDPSGINLPALVNDLLIDTGDNPLEPEEAAKLGKHAKNFNRNALAGMLCHIYHDRYFTDAGIEPGLIRKIMFSERLAALAGTAGKAGEFVSDPDRREEICRIALDAAGLFPLGESEKTARERLVALDSVERKKILDKTAEAQKRAREIREAMLRQEAEEAASKMSRE